MRKQVELLKGAFVFTAQERPEGLRRGFREDLFKKLASADGIFGRLPYAMVTKVGMDSSGLVSALMFVLRRIPAVKANGLYPLQTH